MAKGELLVVIATAMEKKCLSDLHGVYAEELDKAMSKLTVSSYPVEQWNYALTYIFGEPIALKDIASVTQYVKQHK